MVAKQLNSKPKAVTHGLTSIGFVVESRRLPSGNKKPRLYVVPDSKTWREMASRYYYSEDESFPLEAPEALRSSKFVVCPRVSQPSQPSADASFEAFFGTVQFPTVPTEKPVFLGKQPSLGRLGRFPGGSF